MSGRGAAVGFAALLLASCGLQPREQRAAWRAQAEAACLRAGAVRFTAFMQPRPAINGPGVCGLDQPLKVSALSGGAVALTSANTLGCPMVAGAEAWLARTVQPAAQAVYGQPVVGVRSGSFACRSRNNQRGAQLSEHAFGNALDVFSFTFADGRTVKVATGWRGPPDEQRFLREVFVGACETFTTVLGPGADPFHYDHFHLDLARHDPAGRRRVCKPVIKFEPGVAPAPLVARAEPLYSRPPALAPSIGAAPVRATPARGPFEARPRDPQAPFPAQSRPHGLPPPLEPGDVIEVPDPDMIDSDAPESASHLY